MKVAYTPRHLRQQMAAMKRLQDVEFVEVPFEWQTKQTPDAAIFPSYGWVPHEMLRWRTADGTVVPWCCGRQGDTFLMAAEFAARRSERPSRSPVKNLD